MNAIRYNRLRIALVVVFSVVAAIFLGSACASLLNGESVSLTPIFASLFLVSIAGLSVSIVLDRYRAGFLLSYLKKRRSKTKMDMTIFREIAGKEVLVVLATGGGVKGRVEAVEDGWLKIVDKKGGVKICNAELIASLLVTKEK